MAIDPITNGNFDGTTRGWIFEGPSHAIVSDPNAHEGDYCAYIKYYRECAIIRGTRINQSITIPNIQGNIILEFWERTTIGPWAGSCGIKFNDTWIWQINHGTLGRRVTTDWTKQSIDVSAYKGQTIQLAIAWHDPSEQYCSFDDHDGWLRVDSIKLITTGTLVCKTTPVDGAQIWLNGSNTGEVTPKIFTGKSTGSYTVLFKKTGYNDCTMTVTVTAGQITGATCDLVQSNGSIVCGSIPSGALIHLDGENKLQYTPYTFTNITTVLHRVDYYKAGYNTCGVDVTVPAGGSINANCTLALIPTTGSIACGSEPTGALIFLDSVNTQKYTPATLTDVAKGTHNVNFEKTGYIGCNVNVYVEPATTVSAGCTLVLRPTTGSLSITSSPTGAAIWLDGSDTGKVTGSSAVIISNLGPGTHTIVFKKPEYNSCTKQQDVIVGETRSVHCDLPLGSGIFNCYSDPVGAQIWVDNSIGGDFVYKGIAGTSANPTKISGVHLGITKIEFRLTDYDTCQKSVFVEPDGIYDAYCTLVPSVVPKPGFNIAVNIPELPLNSNLYVLEAIKLPFVDWWYVPPLVGLPPLPAGISWDNITNRVYKARQKNGDCDPIPTAFWQLRSNKDHVIVVAPYKESWYPGNVVFKLTDDIQNIPITKSYVNWISENVCAFFGISPAECPWFFATFYDPVFVAELLEIIINHKNLAGESQEPTTLDYVLLPIATAGSLIPLLPAGKLGKYAGFLIKKAKGSRPIKEAFEGWGDDIIEMSIKATSDQIEQFKNAVDVENTIEMRRIIDEVLSNPSYSPWDWLDNLKKIADESKLRVKDALSITPTKQATERIISTQSRVINAATRNVDLYRFEKGDNVVENLFNAALENALRHESLTSTELNSISQLAHNNPELFVKAVSAMTDTDYNLLKKALTDAGGLTEAKILEFTRAISKEGTLDAKGFNSISRMLINVPLAKLTGTEAQIAEAFIREFPTLTGERVLAELALMPADFIKNNPGVKTKAIERLKITKQFSDWEATKAVEGGVSEAIMHYIKRIPSEAAKHPIALMSMAIAGTFTIVGGIVSYIGMGIAPMWFIEETPQTFSLPIYAAIKERNYTEAKTMMGPYKSYLIEMDASIVPWTKKWFFLWAPFVDLAMVAHWNQYAAYELLLGMNTKIPDVPEIFNAKITDLVDADSMHIGVPEDEVNEETGWRVVIDRWSKVKLSEGFTENTKPDIPLNYEIRLSGVNAPESGAEKYLVRRLLCPTCDEERWNATKIIYDTANNWAHTKLWHVLVEMRTDQSNLLDKYNRILVVIYKGTERINTELLKKGHAVVFFYQENNKVNTTEFLAAEKIAKDAKIGIWSIAIETGTIRCVSYPTASEVWLDGVYTGYKTTSNVYILKNVAVGSHKITFKKIIDNIPNSCSKDVIVTQNTEVTAECTLTPGDVPPPPPPPPDETKAIWNINDAKDPNGLILSVAKVHVDDVYVGHYTPEILTFCSGCTCDTVIPCGLGLHTVAIKKTGYNDWIKTRTLIAGDNVADDPVLTKIGQTFPVTIISSPAGATIKVDGIAATISIGRVNLDGKNLIEQILSGAIVTPKSSHTTFVNKLKQLK